MPEGWVCYVSLQKENDSILFREVLPVEPITDGEIVTASNAHQVEAHKSNDVEWSPRASFQAGARWAIEEMKKRGGV